MSKSMDLYLISLVIHNKQKEELQFQYYLLSLK